MIPAPWPGALAVTGWSMHLPGVEPGPELVAAGLGPADWAREAAEPAERAAAVLGRKGLLHKVPAARLALCAVHRALGLEPGARPAKGVVDPGTSVVACGNLGSVATVAEVAREVADGGRGVSVLDAPNVSGNVVASTVAQWFGLGGPNLAVCSGSTAGLDGLRLAALLLRAGRADRVVLVGAEPGDDVAAALHSTGPGGVAGPPLRAGAAAVVLARADPDPGSRLVVTAGEAGARPARCRVGPDGFDPVARWGDRYGGQGVVSLALAAHLAAEGHGPVAVRVPGEDGERRALVALAGGSP